MNRSIYAKRGDKRGSIAVSIALHVVLITLIASITFRYPLSAFFRDKNLTPTEHIQYVKVEPRAVASGGAGANDKRPPKKAPKPPVLLAPTTIPTTLPPVPPVTADLGTVGGTGLGAGAGAGAAAGVEPALPDPRIELRPKSLRLPLSTAARNDSAVQAIYQTYRDAEVAAEENRGRNPRDWTVERNGQKYGIDSQYVYLGKFKLPSAILAALPFNYGGVDGSRLIQNRNAAWIQNDIYSHSQGLSEDDFRAAVKRIRERKDREKKEAQEKDKTQPKPATIVP